MTHSKGGRGTPSAPTGKVLYGFGPPPKVLLPAVKLVDEDIVLVWRRPSEGLSGEVGLTLLERCFDTTSRCFNAV
jgi:hypothetical protein